MTLAAGFSPLKYDGFANTSRSDAVTLAVGFSPRRFVDFDNASRSDA